MMEREIRGDVGERGGEGKVHERRGRRSMEGGKGDNEN